MGYVINIEINGYEFKFGYLGYPYGGLGVYIDFDNEKIKRDISLKSDDLLEAIKELFHCSAELDALYTITNFEMHELQGRGWEALTQYNSFNTLERYKQKALIVLNSKIADAEQLATASTIISILEGNYIFPPPVEKTPEQKAKIAFDKNKNRLKLKLTVKLGYFCDNCATNKENSLCLVQKTKDPFNYDLENLTLRCRGCINKLKPKQ